MVSPFTTRTPLAISSKGNYIGTDVTGTLALGLEQDGINVSGPATTIGGMTTGAGNLISGNWDSGVELAARAQPATWSRATSSAPT